MPETPIIDFVSRACVDVVAMLLLIFGMYYQRYRDKELAIAAGLFNIFVFSVLVILSSVEFGVGTGFGLFAILALFTLRSEQITKTQITYFFGSVAIAVICSVQGTTLVFVGIIILFVLLGAYCIDHPRILHSIHSTKVTLDKIDAHALSDSKAMQQDLSKRLNVRVMSYQIIALDYINDMASINVYYQK